MKRVDFHGLHFQSQLVTSIATTVHLHVEGRNGIELFIKRCECIITAYLHHPIAKIQGVVVVLPKHLHSRGDMLSGLEVR